MKNFISHVRFRMVLPLLFLGVLLTLPTASTGSKYVWNDTIRVVCGWKAYLFRHPCRMKNGKYIQYSAVFHSFV